MSRLKKLKLIKIIAILGPTASGKSDLAVALARKFGGEIISADSRQIYREMDIGTAKSLQKERVKIKHHLIDVKNPNEDYSVGEYKKDAIRAIDKIIKKGKLSILVGGTGLYISAIVNNLEIPEIKKNKKLRAKLQKEIDKNGLNSVFQKLIKIDPEAAYIVDPKNPRRVIRALEIALVSGKKFSEQRKIGKPLYDVLEIGLALPEEKLKEKIKKRTDEMIKMGLVKEVKNLVKIYDKNLPTFDAIGYREIVNYLDGKISLAEAIEEIKKNTRRYAKRQMLWFKKYAPETYWIKNKNEAIRLVRKFLKI